MVFAITVTSTSAWRRALVPNRPPKPDPITTTRCRGAGPPVFVLSVFTSAITSIVPNIVRRWPLLGRSLGHTGRAVCRAARLPGDPLRPRRDRYRLGQHRRHPPVQGLGTHRDHRGEPLRRDLSQRGLHPDQDVRLPRRPGPQREARSGARRGDVVRRSPVAGDPRPHLRPDRPDQVRDGEAYRRRLPNIDVYDEHCTFVDDHTLDTGSARARSPPTRSSSPPAAGSTSRTSPVSTRSTSTPATP